MSKSNSTTPHAKSLGVLLKSDSPRRAREIERLRTELEPIVRVTASGDFTSFNVHLWNLVIAKCADKVNKFRGIDEATESVADSFEQFLKQNVKTPR